MAIDGETWRRVTAPKHEHITEGLRRLAVPLGPLVLDPNNARTHDKRNIRAIKQSLSRFGQRKAIVVRKDGNIVTAGNGTVTAARQLGWKHIAAVVTNDTASSAAAYAIADNRTAELAEWDTEELAGILKDLQGDFDLPDMGFTSKELQTMLDDIAGPPAVVEGEVPAPPADPVTKSGDVWTLGDHRLVCGDCRVAADVASALSGVSINVAFTSPPYASQRKYDESSGFKPIPPDDYVAWFEGVQSNVRNHLAADGSWFVNIKPSADGLDTHIYVMDLVVAHVRQWGWHFATEFCWERTGVPKRVTQRFKNQFEPVYQFAVGRWKMRPDEVRHASDNVPIPGGPGVGATTWADKQGGNGPMFGGVKRRKGGTSRTMADGQGTNIAPGEYIGSGLAYPGNRLPPMMNTHTATGHTAAFPVGLPTFFVKAYSDPGDLIFDPFMGSGTTMVAAQNEDRKSAGIELSPAYCDVIIERWEQLTGGKATRGAVD